MGKYGKVLHTQTGHLQRKTLAGLQSIRRTFPLALAAIFPAIPGVYSKSMRSGFNHPNLHTPKVP